MGFPRMLSREQSRAVDRYAWEVLGLTGAVLMENAAINATSAIFASLDQQRELEPAQVLAVVVCGGGNNGGDGFAIARHMLARGARVELLAMKAVEDLEDDAVMNAGACQALDLPITVVDSRAAIDAAAGRLADADVVIDALLGTGFHGEVRSPMDDLIEACNAATGPLKAAIDTPSGLDCQSGKPSGATFRADLTVTFVAAKSGFEQPEAAEHLGRVVVAEIGLPPLAVQRALEAMASED